MKCGTKAAAFALTLAAALSLALGGVLADDPAPAPTKPVTVSARSQTPATFGVKGWRVTEREVDLNPAETAIVVVDVWDAHWCLSTSERTTALAPPVNYTISAARDLGVQVIHAPSDCSKFYKDTPARKRVVDLPKIPLPKDLPHPDPTQPLVTTMVDMGCDVMNQKDTLAKAFGPAPLSACNTPGICLGERERATLGCDKVEKSRLRTPAPTDGAEEGDKPIWWNAWSRENAIIRIDQKKDLIIDDSAQEMWNVLYNNNIKNVIYIGTALNMCVQNRSFAIKQAVRWGKDVYFVRDATDVVFSPLNPPYVDHQTAIDMTADFIEKFWAPSVSQYDISMAYKTMRHN